VIIDYLKKGVDKMAKQKSEDRRQKTETENKDQQKTGGQNTLTANSGQAEGRPEDKPIYSFPSRSRCPRCGAIETIVTYTQGNVQYRECRRAGCRQGFHVIGKKV